MENKNPDLMSLHTFTLLVSYTNRLFRDFNNVGAVNDKPLWYPESIHRAAGENLSHTATYLYCIKKYGHLLNINNMTPLSIFIINDMNIANIEDPVLEAQNNMRAALSIVKNTGLIPDGRLNFFISEWLRSIDSVYLRIPMSFIPLSYDTAVHNMLANDKSRLYFASLRSWARRYIPSEQHFSMMRHIVGENNE